MNDDITPPEFVHVSLQEMMDMMQKELELPMLKPVSLPITAHTIKPVEQHYYSTVMRPMEFYPTVRHRKYTLKETEYILEYQDCNLWFSSEVYQPPIFGKFDFLKDLK